MSSTPTRIVSLAPSNTEILFAIGAGDRLVGVTQWCNYPTAVKDIEQVAGYSDLNIERITAVRPDLIIAARGNDLEGLRSLEQMGVPVFALNVQTLDAMIDAVRRLGRLTGTTDRSDSLARMLTARLEEVDRRILDRPRPRVLWGYVADPIYTAGPGSLIDNMIERAGGENVARGAQVTWPQVSLETIVAWAPQVLLTSLGGGMQPAGEIDRLREIDGWKELPAIKNGRIVHVEGDLLTRAGPRLVDAVEILANQLHPANPSATETPTE
ncbi:MAG: cobalamin-binding protein [Candidatus Latescibacterota bacterium]|nr:cobalamin-binding protein [Candidatus Latescibacterota bacterium]